MSALARMFAEMESDEADAKSEGLPEAQIERIMEAAARIAAGNIFRIGDLVTIRKDAPIRGAGKPHLVINIDLDAPLYQGEMGGWSHAVRHDVTVLSIHGDHVVPHLVPFWMLEAYSAEA